MPAAAMHAMHAGSGDADIHVTEYSKQAKVVTVLHVPDEVEDNAVRFVLNRFGKVLAGRYLTFKEYPAVYNGIRQYKVELVKNIPSSLKFGGRNCWVRYEGQERTCYKGSTGGYYLGYCQANAIFPTAVSSPGKGNLVAF